MDFSVTKNGRILDKSLYTWDGNTKTFSSKEDCLTLDFSGIDNCTFKTVSGCTFNTGDGCTFNTGFHCKFDTGNRCSFTTESDCTFKTGDGCTFDTGSNCTFKTGSYCAFHTVGGCTFDTGSNCTFDTGCECTFDTGDYCVVVRRDVFEVIEPKEKIKLYSIGFSGFEVLEDIEKNETTEDEIIELNGKKYKLMK